MTHISTCHYNTKKTRMKIKRATQMIYTHDDLTHSTRKLVKIEFATLNILQTKQFIFTLSKIEKIDELKTQFIT